MILIVTPRRQYLWRSKNLESQRLGASFQIISRRARTACRLFFSVCRQKPVCASAHWRSLTNHKWQRPTQTRIARETSGLEGGISSDKALPLTKKCLCVRLDLKVIWEAELRASGKNHRVSWGTKHRKWSWRKQSRQSRACTKGRLAENIKVLLKKSSF